MLQRLGTTLAFTFLLVGCAGGSLGRVGGDNALPKELPNEMKEKFEVRDAPVAPETSDSAKVAKTELVLSTPSPTPSSLVPAPKLKKKSTPAKAAAASFTSATSSASVGVPSPVQYPNRRPQRDPIWMGEKQVYEITYFGMAAGDFTLQILPHKIVANRKVYHVRGTAVSSKVFSLFYRINDQIETFVDYEGLFSHRFHILLDETKQTRDSLELYDSEKLQTFYWNRWNRKEKGYVESKEFFPIPQFPQDSLSALYYLRSRDLPDGAVITFPVVNEGKSWEAVVTVLRREMVDSPMGRIRAIVLKPETKYQGVLQKKGDSFVWLSDDDRRILLRLEAKVRIGTVAAQLKSLEPGQPAP
jgi:hypothetical protein